MQPNGTQTGWKTSIERNYPFNKQFGGLDHDPLTMANGNNITETAIDSSEKPVSNISDLYVEDFHVGLKTCFVVTGVISLLTSLIAITALRRTRKTPPSVKFLATALLLFDNCRVVLTSIRMFVLNPLFNTTLMMLSMISLQLAYFTIGIMTVERFYMFQKPMSYLRVCTQKLLHQIATTVWTTGGILFLLLRYPICYWTFPSFEVFQKAGFCNRIVNIYYLAVLIVMFAISLVYSLRIYRIVREKNRTMTFTSVMTTIRGFKSTSLVMVYCFVSLCTTVAYAILAVHSSLRGSAIETNRILIESVSVISGMIDPFLHVFWFRECQMEVLKMFSFLGAGIRMKVAKMRLDVFDIVIFDKAPVPEHYF